VKEGKSTVDQRQNNRRRKVRSQYFMAKIAAKVKSDSQMTVRKLVAAHGVCMRTIRMTLHEDLDLSENSARWVPKLLTNEHWVERIQACEEFLAMVRCRSVAMLDYIITMDESVVSFYTPETKQQSQQWTKKGQPGPIKAKVYAIRSKQMVLAFLTMRGSSIGTMCPEAK
jgi:hypothetical protein